MTNTFSQNITLITHLRTHTGEKQHQYSYCDMEFTRKWALTMHLKSHTGEKNTNAATVIMLSHCLKYSYKTQENTHWEETI